MGHEESPKKCESIFANGEQTQAEMPRGLRVVGRHREPYCQQDFAESLYLPATESHGSFGCVFFQVSK